MRFQRAAGLAGFLLAISLASTSARGDTINPITGVSSDSATNSTAPAMDLGLEGPDGVLGTADDLGVEGFVVKSGQTDRSLAQRFEPTGAQVVPEASNWITLLTGIAFVLGLKARKARRDRRRLNGGLLKNAR